MIPADFKLRLNRFLLFVVVLTAIFSFYLYEWMQACLAVDLFSYAIIVPAVSVWLVWQQRAQLTFDQPADGGRAVAAGLAAMGVILLALSISGVGVAERGIDFGTIMRSLAYVLILQAGAVFFLGIAFIRQLAFPMLFLFFMVPFPQPMVDSIEIFLQDASAVVSGWFFTGIGLPHIQEGRVFRLPNITIEVAQECSGIRSTIVLFITGLLAAYLFLRKNWQRVAFCALIVPLGIIRNAFRIVTIGWLCTEYGPHMIHSPIHHRGGPVFFALSLIPLLLMVWLFRRMGRKNADTRGEPSATNAAASSNVGELT